MLKTGIRKYIRFLSRSPKQPVEPEEIRHGLQKFEKKFGIHFSDPPLLIQAITHCSYSNVRNEARSASYERLEFLGDAVLDLVVSDYLYHQYRELEEGELTKLKSLLVNKFTLAKISRELGLGDLILLSFGEDKSGGRARVSILSDILESIIGAIYLEGGYAKAKHFIRKYIIAHSDRFFKGEAYLNYKGELLEFLQQHSMGVPFYKVVREIGPEHQKQFTIEVQINRKAYGL